MNTEGTGRPKDKSKEAGDMQKARLMRAWNTMLRGLDFVLEAKRSLLKKK
jgi:hypothetical protein